MTSFFKRIPRSIHLDGRLDGRQFVYLGFSPQPSINLTIEPVVLAIYQRRFGYLLLVALGCLLGACSPSPEASPPIQGVFSSLPKIDGLRGTQPIELLTNTPAETGVNNIKGTVVQHVPLVEQWLYQIDDASGSLWVLTSVEPPAVGSQVLIKAQVQYERILLSGSDIGEHYAQELERVSVIAPPNSDSTEPVVE